MVKNEEWTLIEQEDAFEEIFHLVSVLQKQSAPRNQLCRQKDPEFELELPLTTSITIKVRQDRGVLGQKGQTGSVVWDSSIYMCHFLCQYHEFVVGKRVIELGAGCGLTGITAGILGAKHVDLTDQDAILPLLHRNVILNESIASGTLFNVAQLDWGDKTLPGYIHSPYDIIICCDCIYNEMVNPLLVDTLNLLTNDDSVVFVAQELRTEDVLLDWLERVLPCFEVWRYEEVARDEKHCIVIYKLKRRFVN